MHAMSTIYETLQKGLQPIRGEGSSWTNEDTQADPDVSQDRNPREEERCGLRGPLQGVLQDLHWGDQ